MAKNQIEWFVQKGDVSLTHRALYRKALRNLHNKFENKLDVHSSDHINMDCLPDISQYGVTFDNFKTFSVSKFSTDKNYSFVTHTYNEKTYVSYHIACAIEDKDHPNLPIRFELINPLENTDRKFQLPKKCSLQLLDIFVDNWGHYDIEPNNENVQGMVTIQDGFSVGYKYRLSFTASKYIDITVRANIRLNDAFFTHPTFVIRLDSHNSSGEAHIQIQKKEEFKDSTNIYTCTKNHCAYAKDNSLFIEFKPQEFELLSNIPKVIPNRISQLNQTIKDLRNLIKMLYEFSIDNKLIDPEHITKIVWDTDSIDTITDKVYNNLLSTKHTDVLLETPHWLISDSYHIAYKSKKRYISDIIFFIQTKDHQIWLMDDNITNMKVTSSYNKQIDSITIEGNVIAQIDVFQAKPLQFSITLTQVFSKVFPVISVSLINKALDHIEGTLHIISKVPFEFYKEGPIKFNLNKNQKFTFHNY